MEFNNKLNMIEKMFINTTTKQSFLKNIIDTTESPLCIIEFINTVINYCAVTIDISFINDIRSKTKEDRVHYSLYFKYIVENEKIKIEDEIMYIKNSLSFNKFVENIDYEYFEVSGHIKDKYFSKGIYYLHKNTFVKYLLHTQKYIQYYKLLTLLSDFYYEYYLQYLDIKLRESNVDVDFIIEKNSEIINNINKLFNNDIY